MTVHLIKLAVGIDNVTHLRQVQAARLSASGSLHHRTRNVPRRAGELVHGGSIYWVIRGVLRVRQRLVAVETADKPAAGCSLRLDPHLVLTIPRAHRPFQGWRYLRPEDAPADAPSGAGDTAEDEAREPLPAAMVAELAKLGLL